MTARLTLPPTQTRMLAAIPYLFLITHPLHSLPSHLLRASPAARLWSALVATAQPKDSLGSLLVRRVVICTARMVVVHDDCDRRWSERE